METELYGLIRRQTTCSLIAAVRHVPVCSYESETIGLRDMTERYQNGQRVFELSGASANECEVVRMMCLRMSSEFPDAVLGVGIILDSELAKSFVDAGVHFLAAPISHLGIKVLCDDSGTLWVPCCTKSQHMFLAGTLRTPVIKLFPWKDNGAACDDFAVVPRVRIVSPVLKKSDQHIRDFEHVVLTPTLDLVSQLCLKIG